MDGRNGMGGTYYRIQEKAVVQRLARVVKRERFATIGGSQDDRVCHTFILQLCPLQPASE
jgi:hypothetical protein